MKHFIATISFDADDDAPIKHIVDIGADRMQDCGDNVHIYDVQVSEQDPIIGAELSALNDITDREWRTIHNALCIFQAQTGSATLTDWAIKERASLQQLMDKIRDNYIAQNNESSSSLSR